MSAALKECRHGHMLYNPDDTFIGGSLDKYGEFSEHEVQGILSLLPEGGIALDIGANIGCLTIPIAKRASFVIAVEPQRITFQHLCANVALSALRNVHTIHAAMADKPGVIHITPPDWDSGANNGGFELKPVSGGEPVRVVTVDSLGLQRCDLIKIDVEGMEGAVIAGAVATITRCRPALYVEADREDKTPAMIEQLTGLGYKCWWHLPPLYNENNFSGNAENAFPNIVSINMLCLPDGKLPPFQLYEVEPGDTFSKLMARLAG